jgi:hypothetical protein
MKPTFWIKRFLTVYAGIFVVLLAVYILRGRPSRQAVLESALWSLIASGIFIVNRLIRSHKGQACELCRDTPEFAQDGLTESKPENRRP